MGDVIQGIFQDRFADYCADHPVAYFQRRAVRAIVRCRTAEAGAHAAVCAAGHLQGVHYNSCRHRSCAQCNAGAKAQWLEKTLAQLLPCPHYHVIFTLPSELHGLWRGNRARFEQLLFDSSAGALRTLTQDRRHLGAEVGMLSSLHSWGRSLSLHPHIHMLVTAGGVAEGGSWRAPRGGYLVPVRALMVLFRGQFLGALRRGLERGQLKAPAGRTPSQVKSLLNRLGRVKWSVHIRERYPHGEGVLKYLVRYVRGGPLKPAQVQRQADAVRLRYHDHRRGASVLSLSETAFIARVLAHVPIPRRHTLRRYGLYAHSHAPARSQAREALAEVAERPPRAIAAAPAWSKPPRRCPHCGQPLRYVRLAQVARAPPGTLRPPLQAA